MGPCSKGVSCSDMDLILMMNETPIPVEYRIQVFWTGTARGWGLRTDAFIPMHGLVIQYIGEVIPSDEMAYREQARDVKDTFCIFSVTQKEVTYGIDPLYTGNVARIINHSCDPNLKAYPLDHPPEIKETFPETEFFIPPRIAYYASRDIKVRGGRGTAPSFSLAAPRRASPGGA